MRKAALSALLLACAAQAPAQETEWTGGGGVVATVPVELIVQHERLRDFAQAGEPVLVKRYGPLRMAFHEVGRAEGGSAVPASVLITYRNRLVAAARGYMIGGDFTHNGVLIESWDGGRACEYMRWRLEFSGERLDVTEARSLPVGDCAPN